jgi:hypothetical protein
MVVKQFAIASAYFLPGRSSRRRPRSSLPSQSFGRRRSTPVCSTKKSSDRRTRPVAQAAILAVSLCAMVLASLFSERRASEERLTRSNMMLQHERNNRLMKINAITIAMVHEVRQHWERWR